MPAVIGRGADMFGAAGEGLVAALKAEARRRVESGVFGHIAYASLTARKPPLAG